MATHLGDTVTGLTKMAGIVVVGYGGPTPLLLLASPDERLKAFDKTFGTTLAPTHEAIGDAIEDGWDKKVVHGTTEERSEVVGQVYEGVLEVAFGTKGTSMVVKGIGTASKFALGAERFAVMTEAIANLQKAMKLEALAGKIKGIFKVGLRRIGLQEKFIDDVTKKAAELIKKADEGIFGFSKRKNGPCLSGVYDPKTNKTFFGQNFEKNIKGNKEYAEFVENAHPIIKNRIRAQQKLIDEGKVSADVDRRAGAHSEVRALDDAIKNREISTGKPVTESDMGSFDLHNRHLPSNTPFNRCPNCSNITEGTNVVGGHK
ncbi:hypothetical protein ABIB40_003658 [Pedobacter sp. UYP30]|uniref:hypothetical protein n=1 Tax=Pedobacter sp. UYP30 TaxID=1756400 RepID=UPI0033915180